MSAEVAKCTCVPVIAAMQSHVNWFNYLRKRNARCNRDRGLPRSNIERARAGARHGARVCLARPIAPPCIRALSTHHAAHCPALFGPIGGLAT